LQLFKNLAYFALSSTTAGIRARPVRFKTHPGNSILLPQIVEQLLEFFYNYGAGMKVKKSAAAQPARFSS
jgi:hypothetical protein